MCICGFGTMVGFVWLFAKVHAWLLPWMHVWALTFCILFLLGNHMIRWVIEAMKSLSSSCVGMSPEWLLIFVLCLEFT